MKFTWGTGILVFIILFLLAAGLFIGFAMRQTVSLVHENYYEKGVDHTEQMKINSRSATFQDSIHIRWEEKFLMVEYQSSMYPSIDSGDVHLYRPSDSKLDVHMPLDSEEGAIGIPLNNLVKGRYILKLQWYTEGMKYEVEKDVYIN